MPVDFYPHVAAPYWLSDIDPVVLCAVYSHATGFAYFLDFLYC